MITNLQMAFSEGLVRVSIYEKASPAVVLILTESGSGSGSMLSGDGANYYELAYFRFK